MHLEHFQGTGVLHWSGDLEACLYQRVNSHEACLSITNGAYTNMNRSTSWHADMVPQMTNQKAALRASYNLRFESARDDTLGDIPISAWEIVLKEEHAPTPARMAAAVYNEAPVKFENLQMHSRLSNGEGLLAWKVKYVVNEIVMNKLLSMVEESLEDILKTSSHNAHSGISSVVCKSPDKAMLDLLRRNEARESLGPHIADLSDINAAAKEMLNRVLASSSFMVLTKNFLA